jgi:transposase
MGGFALARAIEMRKDFDAAVLRQLAKRTKNGPQARRLLALASIYDGATRTEAAKIGGVGLQIIRDWVMKFNARGPDGLLDGKAPGRPPRLNDAQRHAVARMVQSGPIPAVHGVVRWRLSRNTVRKVLRSGETSFEYEREIQPMPRLGRWMSELDELLATNAAKPAREQLTLIRIFEELHGRGYEGSYDAVRR